ncbi:MAG: hypothetical protein EHM41_18885 [Chloroflexi bacterium]|nr:MAG: hypothetical protein EHM41_18885 [Chloroflexota bacterium]
MKHLKIIILIILAAVFLTACGSGSQTAVQGSGSTPELLVSSGDNSKSYTRADLEALSASQASFNGVDYQGVTVSALLEAAGFDSAQMKALKAVASDGFTVNYDPSQVLGDDIIIAYATVDGELTEEDGSFRMVLPGAEGKLNVRMLVELQVVE